MKIWFLLFTKKSNLTRSLNVNYEQSLRGKRAVVGHNYAVLVAQHYNGYKKETVSPNLYKDFCFVRWNQRFYVTYLTKQIAVQKLQRLLLYFCQYFEWPHPLDASQDIWHAVNFPSTLNLVSLWWWLLVRSSI